MNKYVLLITCQDEIGLIYRISNILFLNKINILTNGEYVDTHSGQFFFRAEIEGDIDESVLISNLSKSLPANSVISLKPKKKKKILVFATKEHHCLGDLLLRHKYQTFNAEIQGVISNHDILRDLVEKFDIPFHHISTSDCSRREHELKVIDQMKTYDYDFVVLAKYMRILTEEFVQEFSERVVNIHHSFLPAFIGANPYKQAYNRGVKIIGATAHFVTENLDEGPIIHQNIIPVDHTLNAKAMASSGRNVETTVLAKALELVFTDRVMINGNRTIIF